MSSSGDLQPNKSFKAFARLTGTVQTALSRRFVMPLSSALELI